MAPRRVVWSATAKPEAKVERAGMIAMRVYLMVGRSKGVYFVWIFKSGVEARYYW
jgi:hypothetical protein